MRHTGHIPWPIPKENNRNIRSSGRAAVRLPFILLSSFLFQTSFIEHLQKHPLSTEKGFSAEQPKGFYYLCSDAACWIHYDFHFTSFCCYLFGWLFLFLTWSCRRALLQPFNFRCRYPFHVCFLSPKFICYRLADGFEPLSLCVQVVKSLRGRITAAANKKDNVKQCSSFSSVFSLTTGTQKNTRAIRWSSIFFCTSFSLNVTRKSWMLADLGR